MSSSENANSADLKSRILGYVLSNAEDDFLSLQHYVTSGEFRDEELDLEAYNLTFTLLKSTLQPQSNRIRDTGNMCLTLIGSPEFSAEEAGVCVPLDLPKLLVSRASPSVMDDISSELSFIESMLALLYSKFPTTRCGLRREMGFFLRQFVLVPTRTSYLSPILNVLAAVISGMSLSAAGQSLFSQILLPLHRPNGWSFWDRQTPVLAEYHKSLMLCCHAFISKDASASVKLAEYLLAHCFPAPSQANTPKELLLLFELEKLARLSADENSVLWPRSLVRLLVAKLIQCIRSENAQLVQAALLFWKSSAHTLIDLSEFMGPLLEALCRQGEPHWNPTVNKMTLLTIEVLERNEIFRTFKIPNLAKFRSPVVSPTVSSPLSALPDLKFHQLVFGRELGAGAFSTVRYARIIQQGSYLSSWPEVAVKHVSFATIREHKYLGNVGREIGCLRKLEHPGIARLLASFYWRDGVYLVLEIGARGDLHSYVRSAGPLSEPTVQILAGELLAAVLAVHEAGFVYGDLKPENVVITADRHLKLTDFGACRNLCDVQENALQNLNCGDWKKGEHCEIYEILQNQSYDNCTFEGTSAYMPPENGDRPTLLGDAWAMGMTCYFLRRARLPPWAATSDAKSARVDLGLLIANDLHLYDWSAELIGFLSSLLQPEVSQRASIADIHPGWVPDDFRTLYECAVPENHLAGTTLTTNSPDDAWSKRQLSKIWSAQPKDFSFQETAIPKCPNIEETELERQCPF